MPSVTIKSSTLLQAYATFCAISENQIQDFSLAYAEVVSRYGSIYRHAILQKLATPLPSLFPPVYYEFISLTPEQFLRFIVPDLVSDAPRTLQSFHALHDDNILLLAHHIVQIRYVLFEFSSSVREPVTEADNYVKAINKIYHAYVELEKNTEIRLSQANFIRMYESINLHTLDTNSTTPSARGYDVNELYQAVSIFSNQLELPRTQQIDALCRFFTAKEHSALHRRQDHRHGNGASLPARESCPQHHLHHRALCHQGLLLAGLHLHP